MKSNVDTVEEYLQEVQADRKAALAQLRQLCIDKLVGYQESMEYGMPCYKKEDSEVEVAFASQKNYISLYILKEEVLNEYREDLAHLNLGKGCIRYRKPEQIDFVLVEKLLATSFQSDSEIC